MIRRTLIISLTFLTALSTFVLAKNAKRAPSHYASLSIYDYVPGPWRVGYQVPIKANTERE